MSEDHQKLLYCATTEGWYLCLSLHIMGYIDRF